MAKKRRKRSYTYVRGATKPIIRFRFKVIFIIFILVTAICFGIYMTGVNFGGDDEGSYTVTWKERTEETQEETKTFSENCSKQSDEDKTEESVNPVPQSAEMSPTYFGKCVFVGDSITVGLADYQLVPMKNVVAEVGMNIEKINTDTMQTPLGETTALDAITQSAPENVYIMLGSNGIAWLSIDDMIAQYTKFANSVKNSLPEAKIYILSIPPVTTDKELSDEPVSNEDINEYNSKLLDLANENKFYYVDVHSALKNADGVLSAENATEDGMHFNKATYDKMVEYILTHVAEK